jgi:hypothetical protein
MKYSISTTILCFASSVIAAPFPTRPDLTERNDSDSRLYGGLGMYAGQIRWDYQREQYKNTLENTDKNKTEGLGRHTLIVKEEKENTTTRDKKILEEDDSDSSDESDEVEDESDVEDMNYGDVGFDDEE